MIRRTSQGWEVVSHSGKRLGGPYKGKTGKARAEHRLAQVEMFKEMDKRGTKRRS